MNPWYQTYQPPQPSPPTCRSCGSRVVFVSMKRKSATGYVPGGTMPCEAKWEYGDHQKTLVTHDGIMIQKAPPEVLGREPHFGNCRAAAKPNGAADSLERLLGMVDLP